MAYVSVVEWRPEQVTEWLKGLDNSIVSYIHWFSNNEVNGQQLLNLSPDELTHLGVYKLGHQELILEAVQHLRNFHYELDRENLQLLALKLSCASHSLYSEIRDQAESSCVPTQIMADVANVIYHVKPLVSWLDRPPFGGQIQYSEYKSQLLSLSLEMATCAQRDRFAEKPVAKIRTCSSKLAKLADSIIQDITDPMILQPATLDLATIKKKVGEDLDFCLVPSFHGVHQIGDMKLSSPAHQSGKIQQGDEIVQVNYQTVVGWSRKKVLALFEESPNDLLLTLKRRPKHVKMYGQIYMKPYRLPSRKRSSPYSRWNDNLPSPRPELLTIPHFDIARTINLPKKIENNQNLSLEPSGTSSSSDEEFCQPSDSQTPSSMRLYLPKPRASIQRRFTLSGPPRPSAQSEQFWRELQLERSWRSNQNNSQIKNASAQNVGSEERNINEIFHLRDKSASFGNSIGSASSRSTTCVPFTKDKVGSVNFELTKFESFKNELTICDKSVGEERDKTLCDTTLKAPTSEVKVVSEPESNKVFNFSGHNSLSISELNKLKRDAFFNNMDFSHTHNKKIAENEKRENSEKVKLVGNFMEEIPKTKKEASEIDCLTSPGKVIQLVENFERKENNLKNKREFFQTEKPLFFSKSVKEKGRLGKSCSTPTYDNTDCDPTVSKKNFLFDSKKNEESSQLLPKNVLDKCILYQKPVINLQSEDNSVEKMHVKTDNSKDSVDQNVTSPQNCEKSNDNKKCNFENERDTKRKNNFSVGDDFEKENMFQISKSRKQISSSLDTSTESDAGEINKNKKDSKTNFSTENLVVHNLNKNEEQNKPVPAQRKSKLQEKKCQPNAHDNPYPLPPKPRSKLLLSPESQKSANEQLPPEPPPRPESTFPKPINSRNIGFETEKRDREAEFSCEPVNSALYRRKPIAGIMAKSGAPDVTHSSNDLKSFSPPIMPSNRKLLVTTSPSGSVTGKTVSVEKEKPKTSAITLESLKAMLTLGRKPGSINSPRSIRKKNALLAKKRNVSAKEIISFENSGFLWHRNRKGSAVASWTKYFFILQGSNFYGFKSKESHKADLFIHLPGFTCAIAEEVKSKEFSFKIYHTGTVFYFAADSEEDLQQWLDSVNLAISFQDDKSVPEVVNFSQTDSDTSDTEPESETCFPTSPKMKKVLGSSPTPKPARSHQNLSSDTKKTHENQRRFGSLKKLSSQKQSSGYFSGGYDSSEVASLDRKYLRFLGQKTYPTPVPTSRFRSYRRMQPAPAVPLADKSKNKSEKPEENIRINNNTQANSRDPPKLTKKPLHSSNPSLIHPDMADYRITQERLAEFRRLRNQSGTPDTNRLMTLDQLLLSRREDSYRPNRNRPHDMGGLMTLEQFLLIQEEERQRSLRIRERTTPMDDLPQAEHARTVEEEQLKTLTGNKTKASSERNHPSTSNPNTGSRTKKMELVKPQVAPRNRVFSSNTPEQLKNVNHMNQAFFSPQTSNVSTQDMHSFEEKKAFTPENSSQPHCSNIVQCDHMTNPDTLDHQGIEYPPAFEPETYTLQHMLKSRQKRDSDPKNKEDSSFS